MMNVIKNVSAKSWVGYALILLGVGVSVLNATTILSMPIFRIGFVGGFALLLTGAYLATPKSGDFFMNPSKLVTITAFVVCFLGLAAGILGMLALMAYSPLPGSSG